MITSYIFLALVGSHGLFILYGSRRMGDGRLKSLLVGAVLVVATMLAAIVIPCCSYYYLLPVWLPVMAFLVYSDTRMRLAIRQEQWGEAAGYTRSTYRLLPFMMYRDAAASYEVIQYLSDNQMGQALAILNHHQPAAQYFREWFGWYRDLLWGRYRLVIQNASDPEAKLPDQHRLSYRLMARLFMNDLDGYLTDFVRGRDLLKRFPRSFQLKSHFYLFALLGRPDLVAEGRERFGAVETASNWLMWRGMAAHNAGDGETAVELFREAAEMGDDPYRRYVNDLGQAILETRRPTLSAAQQEQVSAVLEAWDQLG